MSDYFEPGKHLFPINAEIDGNEGVILYLPVDGVYVLKKREGYEFTPELRMASVWKDADKALKWARNKGLT